MLSKSAPYLSNYEYLVISKKKIKNNKIYNADFYDVRKSNSILIDANGDMEDNMGNDSNSSNVYVKPNFQLHMHPDKHRNMLSFKLSGNSGKFILADIGDSYSIGDTAITTDGNYKNTQYAIIYLCITVFFIPMTYVLVLSNNSTLPNNMKSYALKFIYDNLDISESELNTDKCPHIN